MVNNNLYDSSVETYGSISDVQGVRNVGRPKLSFAAKIAPFVVVLGFAGLALIASVLGKDQKQVDQNLYAIEEDGFYNKKIVWTGSHWIDEETGKPVEMLQKLLQLKKARQSELFMTQLVSKQPGAPDYNCCYVSKPGGNAGDNGLVKVVHPTAHNIESGFYCHMALKKVPSTQWPMVRLGSLREAEVSSVKGQADEFLAKDQLHECSKDHIFKQTRFSMLAN
mmetsp:Transcript_71330/g.190463  ORF Transcript_71330/g.190463 Transcript_71330/m.190463 type:complete len:223 (-) Transcript_71330:98-766(-)